MRGLVLVTEPAQEVEERIMAVGALPISHRRRHVERGAMAAAEEVGEIGCREDEVGASESQCGVFAEAEGNMV